MCLENETARRRWGVCVAHTIKKLRVLFIDIGVRDTVYMVYSRYIRQREFAVINESGRKKGWWNIAFFIVRVMESVALFADLHSK